jgi:hypothetical protein
MVGAAYSFVKLDVEILRIQRFALVHRTLRQPIGRLTGPTLRVSMPRVVSTPQFSILI